MLRTFYGDFGPPLVSLKKKDKNFWEIERRTRIQKQNDTKELIVIGKFGFVLFLLKSPRWFTLIIKDKGIAI